MRFPRRVLHTAFDIGVLIKGLDGVIEVAAGLLLFVVTPVQLERIAGLLTLHELTEDPHDAIARYILLHAPTLAASASVFGAVYLLGHGIVKVGLVAALLRHRLWAYPTAIVVFLLFLAYQLYRYSGTGSVALLALSVVDVMVIVLTWFEYQRLRGTMHTS